MKQRVISGAVIALFCAAIVLFNQSFPLSLNIAVAAISATAVFELIKALGVERKWFLCLPSVITAAAVPFCGGVPQFLVYCLFAAVIFSALILYRHETSFKEVAVLFSMVVMIPSALQTMVAMREIHPMGGIYYVILALLSAWGADIGAYFAGTFFGKHKLCPEISPKKTVEGAVGGLIFNVAVALFSGFVLSAWVSGGVIRVHYFSLFLIGFFGAPISILGDLSFSLIKRSCHIKDFGQVIPGHGGVLDRFDSVIFTAPFVYLLAYYLPVISL